MGRSVTPKYRLEATHVRSNRQRVTDVIGWDRHHGRPTEANIERYVRAFADSTKPGGVNEQIGRMEGCIVVYNYARIVRQSDGETVAEWRAPMFMAV